MKTKLMFWGISLLLLLLIFGFALLGVLGKIGGGTTASKQSTATSPFGVVPSNSFPTSDAIEVPTIDSNFLSVKDFLNAPSTIPDPSGENYQILAGSMNPASFGATYQIAYDGDTKTFSILLYKAPISTSRVQAEQTLIQELGLSNADMCRLPVFVVTVPGVDDQYLHRNLGLSFCQGAVAL